ASAWIGNHGSGATAFGARARHAEKPLLETNLAASSARSACRRRMARRRTCSSAILTGIKGAEVYLRGLAEERLFEFKGQIGANVFAFLGPAAASPTASAEHIVNAEQIAENVVQVLEWETFKASSRSPHALVSVAVIASTLFGIHQDAVSLGGLFEFDFGFGVTRVAVRMELHRQLAVCAFDFLLPGCASYAQNFVVIAFCV